MTNQGAFGSKEIIMVTGKGGVGKSTIAASFALSAAERELKTKLIELDINSYYEKLFGISIDNSGVEILDKLLVAKWTGMACLQEYVDHLSSVKGLGKLFFENPVMSRLLDIAPGLYELAILGKLTSKIRGHGPPDLSDLLVLDSYSTGHSLSMLRAPKVMGDSISMGPMHDQSQGIVETIQSDKFQVVVVLTPEIMAFEESMELAEQIKNEFGVKPLMVLNKCIREFDSLPDTDVPWENYLFSKQEEQTKVRASLRAEAFDFIESPLVVSESSTIGFLNKVGDAWNLF